MKKYRWIVYLAILAGFALWIYQDYYPPTKPIERIFHISVPKDASEVQARYDWVFQGGHFYLHFKLPSQSFDELKTKRCGDQEFSAEYNQEASTPWGGYATPSWWLTDSTTISVSARCVIPGRLISFYFLVDKSDANLFVIYMRGALD